MKYNSKQYNNKSRLCKNLKKGLVLLLLKYTHIQESPGQFCSTIYLTGGHINIQTAVNRW